MPTKNSHNNELLVMQFKNGNPKAFQKLFELYWESMFVRAKMILSNEDVAKDIVQNIWVELWKNLGNSEIVNFEAYIFKSVRYGCFKYLRANKFNAVQLHVIDGLLWSRSEVENQYNLEETQKVINHSLSKLSPRCQQIFRLSRIEETSNDEIALQLGISKRSVENQVSLALKSIRQNLAILQKAPLIIFYLFL